VQHKIKQEFVEAVSLNVKYILLALEGDACLDLFKPAGPNTGAALIGLNLPLTTLIGIARKRMELTCTQKI
jgi:hypothetical protein